MTDLEIVQGAEIKPIQEVGEKIGLNSEDLELYGRNKAKVDPLKVEGEANGNLVLVTAISPTPAGEGKTTVSVGLTDALNQIGKNTILALREPSLGPVFGMKGGAAGGGYSQVVPMEDLNLHFTGDIHAIGAANNLLAAMLDNHIHQGNELDIDTETISWKRVVDMNDRQLRKIVTGIGGRANGVTREDGFDITVASEIMAIFCLSKDLTELKTRLGKIVVAYNYSGEPVTASDLKAEGAMTALLKDAFKPNLVQTLEHNPTVVHGGPFANIAHGCNSLIATQTALKLGDFVVTEAGFGADLGAEKFINIKSRIGDLNPNVAVLVATVRALKRHGGVAVEDLNEENLTALEKGTSNLERHLANLTEEFNLPTVIALNRFPSDTDSEIDYLINKGKDWGVKVILTEVWAQGGKGAIELAEEVVRLSQLDNKVIYTYDLNDSIEEKITKVAQKIYRADGVHFTKNAKRQMSEFEKLGYGDLPICMAKTQYSFSDDASLLGAPSGFDVLIRELKLNAGAGFIVAMTGRTMTMPGLPKRPAAEGIDVLEDGTITGLF